MRALVVRVGLHRSDVGVHEDNLDAFFLKSLDRLLGLGLGLALHGWTTWGWYDSLYPHNSKAY